MSSEYGSGGKRDLLATQAVDDNIKEAQLFCNENTQSGVFFREISVLCYAILC